MPIAHLWHATFSRQESNNMFARLIQIKLQSMKLQAGSWGTLQEQNDDKQPTGNSCNCSSCTLKQEVRAKLAKLAIADQRLRFCACDLCRRRFSEPGQSAFHSLSASIEAAGKSNDLPSLSPFQLSRNLQPKSPKIYEQCYVVTTARCAPVPRMEMEMKMKMETSSSTSLTLTLTLTSKPGQMRF
ncbi:hypothetical protein ACLKA6_018786 [Drosophila palustris]